MEYYFDTPQYLVPQMQGLSGTNMKQEPGIVIRGVKLDSYGRYMQTELGCNGCMGDAGDIQTAVGLGFGNLLMLGLAAYGSYSLYKKIKKNG